MIRSTTCRGVAHRALECQLNLALCERIFTHGVRVAMTDVAHVLFVFMRVHVMRQLSSFPHLPLPVPGCDVKTTPRSSCRNSCSRKGYARPQSRLMNSALPIRFGHPAMAPETTVAHSPATRLIVLSVGSLTVTLTPDPLLDTRRELLHLLALV
jgi:hypothetical protein